MNAQTKLTHYLFTVILFFALFYAFLPGQNAAAAEITYNVTEYGVTGNGSTDDAAAINTLLKQAADLSDSDTLVLYFPAGKYMIDNVLKIYSNTTLNLDAKAEIYRTDTSNAMLMNVGSDGTFQEKTSTGGGYNLSKNITISGGIFNGGDTAHATVDNNNVNFAHAQNITIENTVFKNNFGAHLVELAGVKNATVKGCDFSNFTPLYSKEDKDYQPKECLQLEYTYCHPTNESLQWCSSYYSDKTYCQNITVENNNFHNYPRGVGNHHGCLEFPGLYSRNVTIRNNTFKDMYALRPNGTKLYGPAIMVHSFYTSVVSDNKIENAELGIFLLYSPNTTIKNNTITNVTASNIAVTKNSKNTVVTGNKLTDAVKFGLHLQSSSSVTTFSGNTLSTGALKRKMKDGICAEEASVSIKNITGNVFNGMGACGIALTNTRQTALISQNRFSSFGKAAIYLSNAACTNMTNNIVTGSSGCNSIILTNKAAVTTISGNTLNNNGKNALSIGEGAKVTLIANNTLNQNKLIGISLLDKATVTTIQKNIIIGGSKSGICITKSTCNLIDSNTLTNCNITIAKKSVLKKIKGNTLTNCSKNAISIGNSSRVSFIANNTITKAGGNGICIFTKSKAGTIQKNTITGTKIGISILNSYCNKIIKNTIKSSKNIGVCSTTSTVNYVQKNKITSGKKAGILFVKKSKGKNVSGNTVKKVFGKSIYADKSSKIKKMQKTKKAKKKKKKK